MNSASNGIGAGLSSWQPSYRRMGLRDSHAYVDPGWTAAVGAADSTEIDLLDFAEEVRENSRLSCQINITADLDGLVVRIPARQR